MATSSLHRRLRLVAWLVSMALLLTACGVRPEQAEGPLVVATTSILGDIASNVVGDEGTVEVLIPIGVDAHDFAPSARQAGLVADADLVVANGLGLEAGLVDVLASAAGDGVEVIEVAPLVDPLPFSHQVEEEDEEHGGLDPHFWMDPARVADAAMAVAERLAVVQPDGAWRERAAVFASAIEAKDDEIEDVLESIPDEQRRMVTNHEAFGYFADHYGFQVLGVLIPGGSTLAEPSSADLAELVGIMERTGVRVIFAETSQPTALAEAVAAELGDEVEVVELFTESLGGPGSGAESLPEMLVTNAERIAAALGAPAPG